MFGKPKIPVLQLRNNQSNSLFSGWLSWCFEDSLSCLAQNHLAVAVFHLAWSTWRQLPAPLAPTKAWPRSHRGKETLSTPDVRVASHFSLQLIGNPCNSNKNIQKMSNRILGSEIHLVSSFPKSRFLNSNWVVAPKASKSKSRTWIRVSQSHPHISSWKMETSNWPEKNNRTAKIGNVQVGSHCYKSYSFVFSCPKLPKKTTPSSPKLAPKSHFNKLLGPPTSRPVRVRDRSPLRWCGVLVVRLNSAFLSAGKGGMVQFSQVSLTVQKKKTENPVSKLVTWRWSRLIGATARKHLFSDRGNPYPNGCNGIVKPACGMMWSSNTLDESP